MTKLTKWTKVALDLEIHSMIDKIQIAEREKFSLIKDRDKSEIVADCAKLGIKEFIKIHHLEITL